MPTRPRRLPETRGRARAGGAPARPGPEQAMPPRPPLGGAAERVSSKERRRKARSAHTGEARPTRSPEERHAERVAERKTKAARRRARRLQEREKERRRASRRRCLSNASRWRPCTPRPRACARCARESSSPIRPTRRSLFASTPPAGTALREDRAQLEHPACSRREQRRPRGRHRPRGREPATVAHQALETRRCVGAGAMKIGDFQISSAWRALVAIKGVDRMQARA